MNRQQNNAKPPGQDVNWPLIACHFVSLPVELLLHNVKSFRHFDRLTPGPGGALLIMFLFVAFHPGENCWPLGCYMLAFVALSIAARIIAMLRLWRGEMVNSRYTGTPYALRLLPCFSEVTIKRLEPFAVLAVGGMIHLFNHPLGSFLIAAGVGMGVKVGIDYRGLRARHLDMHDALISHQISMEEVRSAPDDRARTPEQEIFFSLKGGLIMARAKLARNSLETCSTEDAANWVRFFTTTRTSRNPCIRCVVNTGFPKRLNLRGRRRLNQILSDYIR